MQTRRDYLVGLGLAKPGRGRFGAPALAALAKAEAEGMQFADVAGPVRQTSQISENSADSTDSADFQAFPWDVSNGRPSLTKHNPRVRQNSAFEGETVEGTTVQFGTCMRCSDPVSRCRCSTGPKPPAMIVTDLRPSGRLDLPLDD